MDEGCYKRIKHKLMMNNKWKKKEYYQLNYLKEKQKKNETQKAFQMREKVQVDNTQANPC